MSLDYPTLKWIHQGAVTLSLTGFAVRGAAALTGAAWVGRRSARTLPHVVDTVLLLSALGLAWTLRLTPAQAPWLASKIAGLVVYVALGVVALRPERPRWLRAAAWAGAFVTAGWIVSVAVTKRPEGFLVVFG